jgi:hypothetical protein
MNSTEKLFCTRCIAIATLVLAGALFVVFVNNYSSSWIADMEREISSSLEIVSSNLIGQ